MGRKVALGVILAALSAGAGTGVALASTHGSGKHTKTPSTGVGKTSVHHCHQSPAALAAV